MRLSSMFLSSCLLESKEDLIAKLTNLQRMGRYVYFPEEDRSQAEDRICEISQVDPTDGEYLEWILRYIVSGEIVFPDDIQKIKEQLEFFSVASKTNEWKTKFSS